MVNPPPAPASRILDSHLHVWDLGVNTYPWLGPHHGSLFSTYSAHQARQELQAVGIEEAVLVQAEDSEAETWYMLDVARQHRWIRGVVGWVPLDDAAAARELLDRYADHPRLVGLRHLVHDDPRADLLDSSEAHRTLAVVADRGYPVDIPDAWPRHLQQVERLAAAVPELVVVVDHLAKPPRGEHDFPEWASTLQRVARRQNTVAKVSGLHVPGQPYTPAALRPVWDVALEAFGPDRLLYGSDWPMSVPHGGPGITHEVLMALIEELSPREQSLVLRENTERVYGLDGRPGTE